MRKHVYRKYEQHLIIFFNVMLIKIQQADILHSKAKNKEKSTKWHNLLDLNLKGIEMKLKVTGKCPTTFHMTSYRP